MRCLICKTTCKRAPSTECGHKYHFSCISEWANTLGMDVYNINCPYCSSKLYNRVITRSMCKIKPENEIIKTIQDLIVSAETMSGMEKIGIVIKIYSYLIHQEPFIKKHDKFRRISLRKISEFYREVDGRSSPEIDRMKQVCNDFYEKYNEI
jgi:hypothetical protein